MTVVDGQVTSFNTFLEYDNGQFPPCAGGVDLTAAPALIFNGGVALDFHLGSAVSGNGTGTSLPPTTMSGHLVFSVSVPCHTGAAASFSLTKN